VAVAMPTQPTKVFVFAGFSLLRLLLNRRCENRSASKGFGASSMHRTAHAIPR
jgi:hypothetical protein